MDMSLSELQELVMDREAWRAGIHGSQRVGHDCETELKPGMFQSSSVQFSCSVVSDSATP